MTNQTGLVWSDEMKVGLIGQGRRRWCPRGVKLRQKVQMERECCWLALAADCEDGRLLVKQIANMKSESVAVALQDWKSAGVGAIVWDGAKGHRGPEVRELGVKLISQPPGSPELNPMERLIEEVRRSIEGTVYGNLQSKVDAALAALAELSSDPERLKKLVGWDWIVQAYRSRQQALAAA